MKNASAILKEDCMFNMNIHQMKSEVEKADASEDKYLQEKSDLE